MTARSTIRLFVTALISVALGPVSLTSAASAAELQSHYVLVQNALEKHVIPRIEALDVAAALLPETVARVCDNGDAASREELGAYFGQTVEAWAAVEFLRFGPLTAGGVRERLSFWPDPRGIMARQLRQLIASNDMKAVEAGAIGKQSAAVQGLPALEVLLTDKDVPLAPGPTSAFHCALAKAIASNVAGLAHDLRDAWTKDGGWKDKMLRPGSDNDTYKEPQEAAAELVKALLVGFQLVGDVEVKPQLDAKAKVSGPFEKAGLSKAYYTAGVASLQGLYDAMALESYLPEEKDWVKNWAGGAWRAIVASDGAGGHVAGVAQADAPTLKVLHDRIGGLRKLITGEIAVAAGLTLGFNELDGD